MPAINTRWLTAGQGPRRLPRALTVAQTAQNIVTSIRMHAGLGIRREPQEYTTCQDTLDLVRLLLRQGEK